MRVAQGIGLFLCVVMASCLATKQVKDGRTAFDLKQYAVAVPFLEDEAASLDESDPAYAEVSYLLGEAYKNLNDSENSLKWYIEAAKQDYGPGAYFEMAYMLKKNERYDDAILSFRRLLRILPDRSTEIRKEIEKCTIAKDRLASLSDESYIVAPLEINSNYAEYAPVLFDQETLYFTSDRLEDDRSDVYAWTGNGFANIYSYDLIDAELSKVDSPINTEDNEGVMTFNIDRDVAYFTRCFSDTGDHFCKIMMSRREGDKWGEAEEVITHKPGVNYGDAVLIKNDSILLFTSDDPIGFGGRDLYYCYIQQDGEWSQPEVMPPYLNTIGNERFPTWQNDTLFYSSDYLPGLGGLDIFKTTLNSDNSWTNPVNIGKPFNSAEDDYSYILAPKSALEYDVKSKVYFTTTRSLIGGDDIYVGIRHKTARDYELEESKKDTIVEVAEVNVEKAFFLQVTIKEKLFAAVDNPNSFVVGDRVVPEASIKFSSTERNDIFRSNESGQILLPIDTGSVYTFLAGKEGYLNKGVQYQIIEDWAALADGQVFNLDIEIEKIFAGVEIVLENIYYDFNESFIRDDAKPSLDYLVKVLQDNPALKIQLSSHTDCRGDNDYNQELSQRRAQAAVDYIGSQTDVDANQMSSVGYGESVPEIVCQVCDECSEDEHQINRRTTFKILR
jgi:outer membrane protein OmpA-like peptidoglycan-associated protein